MIYSMHTSACFMWGVQAQEAAAAPGVTQTVGKDTSCSQQKASSPLPCSVCILQVDTITKHKIHLQIRSQTPFGTSRTASNPLLLSLPTLAIACQCSTAHHMLLASTHTPHPQCPHHCTATAACHPHTACTGAEGSGQGQLWHCVQGAAAGGWWGVCHEGN